MCLRAMLARLRLLGSYLATCVKQPSAVRFNGRKAFALLMLLFMGVRLPVYAIEDGDNFNYAEGVLTVQKQLFGANQSGAFASYFFPSNTYTFTMNNGMYTLESNEVSANDPWLTSGYYIDFTFSIPEEGILTFSHEDNGSYFGGGLVNPSNSVVYFDFTDEILITVFIDDVQQQLLTSSNKFDELSYPISHHLRIRISSNFVNEDEHVFYETGNLRCMLLLDLVLDAYFTAGSTDDPTDPTSPSDPSGGGSGSQDFTEIIESIEVVQGHLEEINGNIVDIKDSVEEIEVTVKDTKDQLENPDSNIWQAAGSAISNAVTGLFVPDKIELEAKIAEVEEIITDKLGDTYEVIEKVDQYEDQLVSGFSGGGRQYNFHFPGISVPLPDGTVTILPEQDVSIENDAFIVFRDLLGIGVALLCGFGAVHIAHDFIICILSGVSYWGFIRGRHD